NFTIPAAAILLLAVILFGRAIKRTLPEKPEPAAAQPTASVQPHESPTGSVAPPVTAPDNKPSAAKPAPAEADPAPAASTPATTKPAAAKTATMVIKSTPTGAAILLDQKKTGKVTPATLKVESGRHEITLSKEF